MSLACSYTCPDARPISICSIICVLILLYMLSICVLILLYICSIHVSSYYSIAPAYAPTLLTHYYMYSSPASILLLYGEQAAQVQGLLRGNSKPAIFLRLPGSSMLDPVCQVLTLLLRLLAVLVQKVQKLQHARHLPPPARQLHAST
jgi:hypothetical protein